MIRMSVDLQYTFRMSFRHDKVNVHLLLGSTHTSRCRADYYQLAGENNPFYIC